MFRSFVLIVAPVSVLVIFAGRAVTPTEGEHVFCDQTACHVYHSAGKHSTRKKNTHLTPTSDLSIYKIIKLDVEKYVLNAYVYNRLELAWRPLSNCLGGRSTNLVICCPKYSRPLEMMYRTPTSTRTHLSCEPIPDQPPPE